MMKQFDRFTLTELITQGVGGAIYDGEERLHGGVVRPVRIKILPAISKSDPTGEARFTEEARILAALSVYPNVVTFYGLGITDQIPWIAMEACPDTLLSRLPAAPTDSADVARLIEQVARGLEALHLLTPPRLHNGLNPGNILVWPQAGHFKIAEFGRAAPSTAEPMLSADSVQYAAPELISKEIGKPGPWTDIYALGHIAYEWALGKKLYTQQFPAIADGANAPAPAKWQAWHHSIATVLAPAHEVVQGFPRGLGEVIARMVAKMPGLRYATVAQLLIDLSSKMQNTVSIVEREHPVALSAAPPPPQADVARAGGPPVRVAPTRTAAPQPSGSAAPQAAVAGVQYFVRLRNRTTGPFDTATLQRLGRQGQISRMHQVSTDQRTWKSATSIEGLFT